MLSRIRIFTFLLFLITTINCVLADDAILVYHKKIFNELPKETDLDYYLTALENIVNFCTRHVLYVDLNVEFGLFMIDVNLKELFNRKRAEISEQIIFRMESLFKKNDVLTDYFHGMVREHRNDTGVAQNVQLLQLFYDRSKWLRPSDELNTNLLKQTKLHTKEQLEKMYGQWDNYYRYVIDFSKYKPSPQESDKCVAHLAIHNQPIERVCDIPNNCKGLVKEGSEYGYGLSHRLLVIMAARFSKKCFLFSEEMDKFKSDVFCLMCYNEAEYIALNNFGLPDLMLEQIAFCTLFGHAQFLRAPWLKSLLLYQTSEGCFSEKVANGLLDEALLREKNDDKWKMDQGLVMNGQCNNHLTAVATMALANVVRFIMEAYY